MTAEQPVSATELRGSADGNADTPLRVTLRLVNFLRPDEAPVVEAVGLDEYVVVHHLSAFVNQVDGATRLLLFWDNDDPADAEPITGVDATLDTFTVAGNRQDEFRNSRSFTVANSTANDGTYMSWGAIYDEDADETAITVAEIIDATVDGDITSIVEGLAGTRFYDTYVEKESPWIPYIPQHLVGRLGHAVWAQSDTVRGEATKIILKGELRRVVRVTVSDEAPVTPVPPPIPSAVGSWSFINSSSMHLLAASPDAPILSKNEYTMFAAVRTDNTGLGVLMCLSQAPPVGQWFGLANSNATGFAASAINVSGGGYQSCNSSNSITNQTWEGRGGTWTGANNQTCWFETTETICPFVPGLPLKDRVIIGGASTTLPSFWFFDGRVAEFSLIQGNLTQADFLEWRYGGSHGSFLAAPACSWSTSADATGRILVYMSCRTGTLVSNINGLTATFTAVNGAGYKPTSGPVVDPGA